MLSLPIMALRSFFTIIRKAAKPITSDAAVASIESTGMSHTKCSAMLATYVSQKNALRKGRLNLANAQPISPDHTKCPPIEVSERSSVIFINVCMLTPDTDDAIKI